MAVTVVKIDGSTEEIQARPGVTCKDAMIDLGIYSGPPDSFEVLHQNTNVDYEPLENYDGQKLTLVPVKKKGGAHYGSQGNGGISLQLRSCL